MSLQLVCNVAQHGSGKHNMAQHSTAQHSTAQHEAFVGHAWMNRGFALTDVVGATSSLTMLPCTAIPKLIAQTQACAASCQWLCCNTEQYNITSTICTDIVSSTPFAIITEWSQTFRQQTCVCVSQLTFVYSTLV